jgi:hypothetical protein
MTLDGSIVAAAVLSVKEDASGKILDQLKAVRGGVLLDASRWRRAIQLQIGGHFYAGIGLRWAGFEGNNRQKSLEYFDPVTCSFDSQLPDLIA